MSTPQNNCPCPQGYTPDSTGTKCVKTLTSAPTQGSTTYTVAAGNQNINFGSQGTNFYQDISNTPYPITFVALPTRHLVDANGVTLTVSNTVSNNLWGFYNPPPAPSPPYYGRLNDCGVWTNVIDGFGNAIPLDEWIGFSACVNVPVTGTYCIAFAADNACRIKINGQIIAELFDITSTINLTTWIFNKWHVFPITLQAGLNAIGLEGLNHGQWASFGAEIYGASLTTPFTSAPAAVATLSALTTEASLSALTIFTSKDKIGQTFQSGQFSGLVCPDGCTLNLCGPTPRCSCLDIINKDACCFRMVSCTDPNNVIITSTDLSAYVGQVITVSGQTGCWQVSTSPDCTGSVAVTGVVAFADCVSCLPCWKLTNCADNTQVVTTNQDLTSYVGQSVQIAGYPGICWAVSVSSNCAQPSVISITKSFSDCATCAKKCYVLSDCEGVESPIITDTDLSQYVGQVVHLKDCANHCWTVNLSNTCRGSVPVEVSASFGTCALCNPPLVCPAPELLHQRKIYPGYNTPGCSPEYTEKVNCEFAEAIYTQVKQRRYGISPCCEEDFQKWSIKKKLLDLRAIWDPELCVSCKPITCCTPCPIPTPPVPPTPEPCPAPGTVTATIEVITPCPVEEGDATATITFNNSSSSGFPPRKF